MSALVPHYGEALIFNTLQTCASWIPNNNDESSPSETGVTSCSHGQLPDVSSSEDYHDNGGDNYYLIENPRKRVTTPIYIPLQEIMYVTLKLKKSMK